MAESPGVVPSRLHRKVKGDTARVGNLPPEGGKRGDVQLAPATQRGAPGEAHGYAVNGTEEVDEWVCVEGCPVDALDRQSGQSGQSVSVATEGVAVRRNHGAHEAAGGHQTVGRENPRRGHADSGGASRFFARFGHGIDEQIAADGPVRYVPKAPSKERPFYVDADGVRVAHSTVKPLKLVTYLCTLLTPPGGTILDPFTGSGTTAEAAILTGMRFIGCELTDEYLPLIEQRIARGYAGGPSMPNPTTAPPATEAADTADTGEDPHPTLF